MNFNPYYKKPKPSTMKANREIARKHFKKELKWLKDNIDRLTKNKHKFLIEMYMILVTGNRRFTDKMLSATRKSIKKCMNNPNYNVLLKTEAAEKMGRITYYMGAQVAIFAGLQSALFAMMLNDEDVSEDKIIKTKEYTLNTISDSFLRGMGIQGAIASSFKNATIKPEISNTQICIFTSLIEILPEGIGLFGSLIASISLSKKSFMVWV